MLELPDIELVAVVQFENQGLMYDLLTRFATHYQSQLQPPLSSATTMGKTAAQPTPSPAPSLKKSR